MASKEATKVEAKAELDFYAFEFSLLKDKIGEKTTNPQVKSKVAEAFMGYGAFTETQVIGAVGADRTVIVFFARLFGKGQPAFDKLKANETVTIKIYDEDVEIKLSGAKPSGGGATTGTSSRPKKEVPKTGGRGKKPAGDKKDGEKKDGAAGDKKEGDDKKRPERKPKTEEKLAASLQRGRANIGGKLGPISKVRLAKQAKEARDKENAARIARGEEPLPDPKAKGRGVGHDDDDDLPPKKEAGKKGGKDAGKAAAKAPAKAAAPKKK